MSLFHEYLVLLSSPPHPPHFFPFSLKLLSPNIFLYSFIPHVLYCLVFGLVVSFFFVGARLFLLWLQDYRFPGSAFIYTSFGLCLQVTSYFITPPLHCLTEPFHTSHTPLYFYFTNILLFPVLKRVVLLLFLICDLLPLLHVKHAKTI